MPVPNRLQQCSLVSSILLLGCTASVPRDEAGRVAPPSLHTPDSPRAGPPTTSDCSSRLDRVAQQVWDRASVTPAPIANDSTFLRRVYLDLVGRLPTAKQARAFLADQNPDKRARLIQKLLTSESYAQHWGEVYFDWLVPVADQYRPPFKAGPRAWLEKSFVENRPYDDMVTTILTAEGELRHSGAGAFLAARLQGGNIGDVTAATLETFLDLGSYQCAQCHDHPWDDNIRQRDFAATEAFFARLRIRTEDDDLGRTLVVYDADHNEAPEGTVSDSIQPAFLGTPWRIQSHESRRQALARAVVSSERLAETLVDKMWLQLFGRHLGDEASDLRDFLARDFRRHNFDLRHLLKTITSSSVYQRSARLGGSHSSFVPEDVFARARIRRVPPKVLFRMLLQVMNIDPRRPHILASSQLRQRIARNERRFHERLPRNEDVAPGLAGTIPQTLMMLNDWLINGGTKSDPASRLQYLFDRYSLPEQRLRELYLTVYTRRPTPSEQQRDLAFLHAHEHSRQAWEDLFYAMVVTTEFVTNH